MITAQWSARITALIPRLENRARRAVSASRVDQNPGQGPHRHPWRSPQRLWPDIFEDA